MLKHIDSHKLFLTNEGIKPVLLLDGHHSRFELPFIKYCCDSPEHEWVVCIGVPCGTHIWQVHDSSQMNGLFKGELSKAKQMYMKLRDKARKGL